MVDSVWVGANRKSYKGNAMNETFLLYVLTRLNKIVITSTIIGLMTLFVMLIMTAHWWSELENEKIPSLKKFWAIPIASLLISVFVPTQKDALFIIAGTKVIELAKDPDIKRVAGKSAQLIEKYIDNLLEEKK